MNTHDNPSPMLVAQRIRNRLIEYFETTASYPMQQAFQLNVPAVHVPTEIINQWEDWVDTQRLDGFIEPVFSQAEQVALREFHEVWEGAVKDTPTQMPELSDLIGKAPWERLRQAAEKALWVFNTRGKLNEEQDAFPS